MIHVCRLRTTCSCSRGEDFAVLRLSMKKYAASVATIARPAYTHAARCRSIPPSRGLDQPEDPGAADDDGQEELDQRDTEVAAGGVEAQRGALLGRGVEEVDVGHRAGEVAAAEAGRGGDEAEHPVRRLRSLHGVREAERRDEQQRRADHRPVAATELRHREGVRQPQQRADEVGQRHQQEELLRREVEARSPPGRPSSRSRSATPRSRGARRRSTRSGCAGRPTARWSPRSRRPRDASPRSSGGYGG